MQQRQLMLFVLASALGCGATDLSKTQDPDSGTLAPDSGPADTGSPSDSGAAEDTGAAADTGAAVDTGTGADAGQELDAGQEMDAGDVDGGPPAMGACTNPADEAIHNSTDVAAGVEECARGCFGGRPCTRQCIVDDVGLTEDCADCYAGITSCTIQNCLSECSGSDSAACEQCRDDSGCTAEFEMCSGR